jgi:hypothetical protein
MGYSGTPEEKRAKQCEVQRRYRDAHRKPRVNDWAPGDPKYKTDAERKEARLESARRCQKKRRASKPELVKYQRDYMRVKYPELRDAVIEKLGGKCALCGYDADRRAFQIDHIDGQGRKERRTIGWYKFFNQILVDTTNYQLLCANCNYIKRYTNNEVYIVDQRLKD